MVLLQPWEDPPPPPKSFHIRLYLWSKTPKPALGIQVPKSPVPSSSLWTAVYLYLPNALNPSAVSKWSKQCWWKNLVTKGEWGQLRRRRTTQDTATDIWHLAKHPLNVICRHGTGKVWFWDVGREVWGWGRDICWGWDKKNLVRTA